MCGLIDYVRAGKIKPILISTAPIGSLNDRLAESLAGKVQGRQVLVHDAHSMQIGERLPGVLKRHSIRLN